MSVLSESDFVYVWVDGIHLNIRLDDDRLVALEDGYRESAESWASVLRDLSRRGLRAPVMAIGDGALGLLGRGARRLAGDDPTARLVPQDGQRARQAPQTPSAAGQAGAARDHVCGDQERRRDGHRRLRCRVRGEVSEGDCLPGGRPGRLLAFFAFPAEHWRHLRTSNLIESPFVTVRLRQRVTKGAGSRTKGLLMAYKLLDMA